VIAVGQVKRGILGIVVVVALTAVAGAPQAFAQSPWWHLTSGTAPANLSSGHAKNEVQELTTSPEVLFELEVDGVFVGIFATEPYTFGFFPEASAANVQAALEGVYGAGDVQVSGGVKVPGGPAAPLLITTVNEKGDQRVMPIQLRADIGTGEAKVVTEGQPDGYVVVVASNLGDEDVNGEAFPVTIADTLPSGLKAVGIEGVAGARPGVTGNLGPVSCSRATLSCTFEGTFESKGKIVPKVLPPYHQI
jgi:hypothetical protein